MTEENRASILAVIWFSMGITSIGVAVSGEFGLAFFAPLLIALLTTFLLDIAPSILSAALDRREKAKGRPQDRVSLLMDLLNEDERAVFKAALQQRILDDLPRNADGELPDATLAALLSDDDAAHAARQK